MKILFINLPYYGHVIPTFGLVKELIRTGNQVTYLMPFDWKDKIAECGAEFAGYQNHKKLDEQIKNAYAAAVKLADEFDLILYEQFFFLGKHLAERFSKPVVRIFTAPATNHKLMQEYLQAGGALGLFRFPWIGRMWTKSIARDIPLKTDCWLSEIIENPPELNLVYTLKKYQPYAEDFSEEHFKFLGVSSYERQEDINFMIPDNKPLIYISFGTVIKGSKRFFKKCFEAFKNENVNVILSVGNSVRLSRLGEIPDNVMVYPYVPQLRVLKSSAVFITHGGMNSISEALSAGVPMIVIPFMSDQPTNARRIEELGLGVQMSYKKLTSDALRTTVNSLLKNECIRSNVKEMQQEMLNCPGNGAGVKWIMKYYQAFDQ